MATAFVFLAISSIATFGVVVAKWKGFIKDAVAFFGNG